MQYYLLFKAYVKYIYLIKKNIMRIKHINENNYIERSEQYMSNLQPIRKPSKTTMFNLVKKQDIIRRAHQSYLDHNYLQHLFFISLQAFLFLSL